MDKNKQKQLKKQRRQKRVRAKIKGAENSPRLSVFRSNTDIYLQLINDEAGITLASANSKEAKKGKGKVEKSFEAGKLLAERAAEKKIENVVFDRSGYRYHGRVKAAADGAREGGLKF